MKIFKIKIERRPEKDIHQWPTPRAVVGDIIICNLPEGDSDEFYIKSINKYGSIIGSYINNKYDGNTTMWPYGENYNILCNAVSYIK